MPNRSGVETQVTLAAFGRRVWDYWAKVEKERPGYAYPEETVKEEGRSVMLGVGTVNVGAMTDKGRELADTI